ncbi:MAG: hypothetical protein KAG89_17965 [Fulvimarina manganoxydans]|uniref:TraC family protein n=1 Tax=Fulvimarina manganoxydans TaxID=937218 RepID=UPI002354BB48|nr:TraC family protein [Fulvimarina manganoxydans]MCK5934050.1 hypothetical protein [Fulvimarina manganoxydans]
MQRTRDHFEVDATSWWRSRRSFDNRRLQCIKETTMRKPRKSRQELLAERNRIDEQLKVAEKSEELEFGKMARKAGIFDLDLSDVALQSALQDMAARFQANGSDSSQTKAPEKPSSQTTASSSHDGTQANV